MAHVKLSIVCDDLGICRERDAGILKCIKYGVATKASILPNGKSSLNAIDIFRKSNLLHTIGLHLNLTEGQPISPVSEISSLLNPDGTFMNKTNRNFSLCLKDHISIEITAQINWFTKHIGYLPSHIDGHQHCHVHPIVSETFARVVSDFGIQQVRIPNECYLDENILCQNCEIVQTECAIARRIFRKYGLFSPSLFIGLTFCNIPYTVETFVKRIQNVKNKWRNENEGKDDDNKIIVIEIMVHPGLKGNSWDHFNCSTNRQLEMEVLCDPECKEALFDMLPE
jgi:predicted glycoside hydrolase/deacetylase ChbG (UPF0249 family)